MPPGTPAAISAEPCGAFSVLPDGHIGKFILPVLIGQHEFAFNVLLHLIREGIIDQHGIFARRSLLFGRCQRIEGAGAQAGNNRPAMAERLQGSLLDRLNRAAGQDIMELAHAQRPGGFGTP